MGVPLELEFNELHVKKLCFMFMLIYIALHYITLQLKKHRNMSKR